MSTYPTDTRHSPPGLRPGGRLTKTRNPLLLSNHPWKHALAGRKQPKQKHHHSLDCTERTVPHRTAGSPGSPLTKKFCCSANLFLVVSPRREATGTTWSSAGSRPSFMDGGVSHEAGDWLQTASRADVVLIHAAAAAAGCLLAALRLRPEPAQPGMDQ